MLDLLKGHARPFKALDRVQDQDVRLAEEPPALGVTLDVVQDTDRLVKAQRVDPDAQQVADFLD